MGLYCKCGNRVNDKTIESRQEIIKAYHMAIELDSCDVCFRYALKERIKVLLYIKAMKEKPKGKR